MKEVNLSEEEQYIKREVKKLAYVYEYTYEFLKEYMPKGWLKKAGTHCFPEAKYPGVVMRRAIMNKRENLLVMRQVSYLIKEYIPMPYDAGHKEV